MIADQEFSRARQEPTVFTHAFELEASNEQPKHGPTTGRMAWQATTSSSARASDSFVDSHAWDYVVVSRRDIAIAGIWVAFFSGWQRYRSRQDDDSSEDKASGTFLLKAKVGLRKERSVGTRGAEARWVLAQNNSGVCTRTDTTESHF